MWLVDERTGLPNPLLNIAAGSAVRDLGAEDTGYGYNGNNKADRVEL
jgi:hypothetical protein